MAGAALTRALHAPPTTRPAAMESVTPPRACASATRVTAAAIALSRPASARPTSSSQSGEFRSSPTAPDSTAPYPNGAECHFVADVGTGFGYVSFTIIYDVELTFDFVTVKEAATRRGRASPAQTQPRSWCRRRTARPSWYLIQMIRDGAAGLVRPTWGLTTAAARTASAAATGRAKAEPASALKATVASPAPCRTAFIRR